MGRIEATLTLNRCVIHLVAIRIAQHRRHLRHSHHMLQRVLLPLHHVPGQSSCRYVYGRGQEDFSTLTQPIHTDSPASFVATIVSKQFDWFITSLLGQFGHSPCYSTSTSPFPLFPTMSPPYLSTPPYIRRELVVWVARHYASSPVLRHFSMIPKQITQSDIPKKTSAIADHRTPLL